MAAPMTLTPPAGGDALQFKSLVATEEVSRPFEFVVEAVADDGGIDTGALLGKPACVQVELADGSMRPFHGLVCEAGLEGMDAALFSYRLVLRPWLWLLTRRRDTRIFQNKSLQDILKAVFQPFSVDYRFSLRGTPPTYEYKVQYRETDFEFVSRLLEQEGLYYFFEHTTSKHTLVIVDDKSAHADVAGSTSVPFRQTVDALIDMEAVTDWRLARQVLPGKAVLTDYNFTTPSTSLQSQVVAARPGATSTLEVYDYPGRYGTTGDGTRYTELRVETEQSGYVLASGAGPVRNLAAGACFTLKEHPADAQNARYLILSTVIEAHYSGYRAGPDETRCTCRFTALPDTEQYRAPCVTPLPIVPGPQPAVVTGPSGEEIYSDQYGRVKVQFFWDRLGTKDENSSCWVRVSSPWAGAKWGMIALPRIGQEVVVSFVDGDPDRPLVTGRVHNAEQMPPYTLPDDQTISTWKSRSSKGGGEADYNELRFEDKKGSEYVLLQAQKDFIEIVENDHLVSIGHDETRVVKNDQTEDVQGADKRTVGKDSQESVGGKRELTVGGDMNVDVGGTQGTKAATDIVLEAGAGLSIKTGANGDIKIGANLGVDTAANIHLKGGANVVIEAGAMLTLKAGSNSVVIGPSGVTITGTMVMINSGGGAGAGAGASPKDPTKPAEVKAPDEPKDPHGS